MRWPVEEDATGRKEEDFSTGPHSVLMMSVRENTQGLINLRNKRQLLAHVRAFDLLYDMVLENIRGMWTVERKTGKGKESSST
uniref:Small nuclear ribonucleoprotein Sm D2 n=1 Tax=Populus trichocarpa TaxID=3694 RepID=A0A2K2BIG6_POPTR